MRIVQPVAGGLSLLAACGLLSGCGTLFPEPSPGAHEAIARVEPLAEEQAILAEGLADYAQGLLHDLEREPDAALTYYLRAVELDPGNEALNIRTAMGLLQQQRTDEAIALVEALAERRPASTSAQAWLALVYRVSEQPERAIAAYQRLIDIKPALSGPYLELAGYYLRLGRRDQSVETLQRGIQRAEEPVPLYHSLARLYIEEAQQSPAGAGAAHRRAIDLLEKAVELAPDDVNLRLQLGDLHIRQGQPGRAVRQFQSIEQQYPDDLGIKRRLALNFLALGESAEAIDRVEALAAADPTNRHLPYYLGELYLARGDREQAFRNFRLAAAAGDPAPWLRMAAIQIETNDFAAAIETLNEALTRVPGDPRLTELLGYAYLSSDQPDLALAWLRKAEAGLEEDDRGRVYYQLATASYLAGSPEDALAYAGRALDQDTRFLQAFVRDVLQLAGDDLDDAVDLFQQLADRTPDEPAVFLYLGMIKSYADRHAEAVEDFARVAALASENRDNRQIIDADFYFAYGAAHERLGNYEQAEELFGKALVLDPRHASTRNYLAYMWAEQGVRLDEALEHIRVALEVNPDSGAFIDTLGWIYHQQGNYEDALREIRRAMELTPADPTITEHLGDTLHRLGRTEEAVAQWTASFLLDPESESVAAKLAGHGIELEPLRDQAREQQAARSRTKAGEGSSPAGADLVAPAPTPLDETTRDPAPEDLGRRLQDLGVPLAPTNAQPPVLEIAPEDSPPSPPDKPAAPVGD